MNMKRQVLIPLAVLLMVALGGVVWAFTVGPVPNRGVILPTTTVTSSGVTINPLVMTWPDYSNGVSVEIYSNGGATRTSALTVQHCIISNYPATADTRSACYLTETLAGPGASGGSGTTSVLIHRLYGFHAEYYAVITTTAGASISATAWAAAAR